MWPNLPVGGVKESGLKKNLVFLVPIWGAAEQGHKDRGSIVQGTAEWRTGVSRAG